jgi:hypothetical protein
VFLPRPLRHCALEVVAQQQALHRACVRDPPAPISRELRSNASRHRSISSEHFIGIDIFNKQIPEISLQRNEIRRHRPTGNSLFWTAAKVLVTLRAGLTKKIPKTNAGGASLFEPVNGNAGESAGKENIRRTGSEAKRYSSTPAKSDKRLLRDFSEEKPRQAG